MPSYAKIEWCFTRKVYELYFQLFIGKRIEEANIEQEIWKIGNDIKNPKKEND